MPLVPRKDTGCFSGDEALKEVAKTDGSWNWCLFGPDPEKLPLSGGGCGSIAEMREGIGAHPMSYGLLRISFGTGKQQKTRWVFIHASDEDDTHAFSVRERGRAAAQAPKMEAVIGKYAQVSTKVQINSKDDCTPDFIIGYVAKISNFDGATCTVDEYTAALREFRSLTMDKEEEEIKAEACKLVEERAPAAEEAPPAPEPELRRSDTMETPDRQRKKMKLFKKGDPVSVFSNVEGAWHDDGLIVENLEEACRRDGLALPAGSMKAQYDNGRRYRWITPVHAKQLLRASTRPAPPLALTGELNKETHTLTTEWPVRYAEVSKGFLQWWMSAAEARNGAQPNGVVSLMGLEMRIMGTVFSLRTSSTKGVIHSFDATTDDGVDRWTGQLDRHADYCEAMRVYLTKSKDEAEQESLERPPAALASRNRKAVGAPCTTAVTGRENKYESAVVDPLGA